DHARVWGQSQKRHSRASLFQSPSDGGAILGAGGPDACRRPAQARRNDVYLHVKESDAKQNRHGTAAGRSTEDAEGPDMAECSEDPAFSPHPALAECEDAARSTADKIRHLLHASSTGGLDNGSCAALG